MRGEVRLTVVEVSPFGIEGKFFIHGFSKDICLAPDGEVMFDGTHDNACD